MMKQKHFSGLIFAVCCFLISSGISADLEIFQTPDRSRNESPALTFTPDGGLWLSWASFQSGKYRLAAAFRGNEGWSEVFYPDDFSGDQIEPQWMQSVSGDPGIVYSVYNGRKWKIRMVIRKEGMWETPVDIGTGYHPDTAEVGSKNIIAWENNGLIMVMCLENGKKDIRKIQPPDSRLYYSNPSLAAGPSGVWMAFTSSRINYQSVLLMRIDGNEEKILKVDQGNGVNREPKISIDNEGKVWIVYEALNGDTPSDSLEDLNREHPRYVMDRTYHVEFPSMCVVVTDGRKWWKPERPNDPAPGLRPNVHCAKDGTVRILSRSFVGNSRPYREYFPLYESLGPDGWMNHGVIGPEKRGYKETMPFAESPDGGVWTAWVPNDRKRLGASKTPSWTFLDGTDDIAVAPLSFSGEKGHPVLKPFPRIESADSDLNSLPHYKTTYEGKKLNVYFGDLHQHSEFSGCGRMNGFADQNQHYTRFVRDLDFMSTIDHAEHLNDHNWRALQLIAEKYNSPGSFVSFTGFEWTSEFDAGGNLYRGHYNAIFRDVNTGDYYFSASDPRYNTPMKLWEALKQAVGGSKNVLTFPHHTSRRMAWLSWSYYDPDMVPLIEIAQSRGSYEYEGCISHQIHLNDCSRVSGHFIHDGLKRGMRWGFAAAGDHGGRQLTAVFSPELTRDSVFSSLKNRRTYATNGERMFLDVRVNGHFMGEEFLLQKKNRTININAKGTAPLMKIDLFRNGRIIKTVNPNKKVFSAEWEDGKPLLKKENYYYLRAVQMDGGQAWSSPIWVVNPNVKGEFNFQMGGDELHVTYPGREEDLSVLMHNETESEISGTVYLDIPADWKVMEKDGIKIECPPGSWRQAVFAVVPPLSCSSSLSLPKITAVFRSADGKEIRSPFFVVNSKKSLSREQKAVLIDARRDLSKELFLCFLNDIKEIWRRKSP